jgi:hypothetical protein
MLKDAAVLAGAFFFALAAPAFQETQTVTGQLVDLSCYSQDKDNAGNHHVERGFVCAQACAREGFEVGLLTPDGKVYHVRGELTAHSNSQLVPYMAETVTITGTVSEKEGQLLIVSSSLRQPGKRWRLSGQV